MVILRLVCTIELGKGLVHQALLLRQDLSMNLELTDWLAQLAWPFMWVLEIHSQALTLAQQTLYPPSHLLNSLISLN